MDDSNQGQSACLWRTKETVGRRKIEEDWGEIKEDWRAVKKGGKQEEAWGRE